MIEEKILTEYYSEIANKLNELIPIDWKRVAMYTEVDDGWSTTTFYFIAEDDIVYHWGDIFEKLGVDENEFDESFDELSDINEEFWNEFKMAEVDLWSSFSFDMTLDGKFKVEFNYNNLDEEIGPVGSKEIWAYDTLGLIPKDKHKRAQLCEWLEKQGKDIPEEFF